MVTPLVQLHYVLAMGWIKRIFLCVFALGILQTEGAEPEECTRALASVGESAFTYYVYPTQEQATKIDKILSEGDNSPNVDMTGLGLIETFDTETKAAEHFISLYLYIYQNCPHAPYLRLQSLNNIISLFHLSSLQGIQTALSRLLTGKKDSPDRLTPFDLFHYALKSVRTLKDFKPLEAAEAKRILDRLVASSTDRLERRDLHGIYYLDRLANSTEAPQIGNELKKLFDRLKDHRSQYYVRILLNRLFQDSRFPEELALPKMESPVIIDLRNSKSFAEFKALYDETLYYTFIEDNQAAFDIAFDNSRFAEARLLGSRRDKRRHYDPRKVTALLAQMTHLMKESPQDLFESDIIFMGKFGIKEDIYLLEQLKAATGEKHFAAIESAIRALEARYHCEEGGCDYYGD